jgi:23S rRNA (cytosine1962-C5)-methyltransferase
MLAGPYHDLPPGALVEALGRDERFVGRGFYNPRSEIALRLLTEDPAVFPGADWFREQIKRAADFRREALSLGEETDAYRVVHSEGDGLSGLVVDRFGPCLAVELFSAGMHRHLAWVKSGLEAEFPGAELVVRADHRSEKLEGLRMDGPPPSAQARAVRIREGPARFHVDLRRGHKTGFFLDQRENRARSAELARGREVLDGFCYTGAFGIRAALAGAKSVEAADLDETALAVAERNRELNGLGGSLRFVQANVFDLLRERRSAGRKYGMVILDPSKQAVSRHEVGRALAAYRDLNRLALQCLQPGGVLLSCSCTGLISEEEFLAALASAAEEARMELQVFLLAGAAPDHPFAVRAPEGRYLKAVFARARPRE